MFDCEINKQHQRVLCNEICRLRNKTINQFAVRIETLVRKFIFSIQIIIKKTKKKTDISMMTLTHNYKKMK